jgi:hypothetical protein
MLRFLETSKHIFSRIFLETSKTFKHILQESFWKLFLNSRHFFHGFFWKKINFPLLFIIYDAKSVAFHKAK